MRDFQMLIDGVCVDAAAGERFQTLDPYTGAAWASIPRGRAEDADRAATAAHRALTQGPWATMAASERGKRIRRLGELIAAQAEELARIEVRDNGKLMAEMGAQLRYLPEYFHYFGGLADKIEGEVPPVEKPGVFAFTRHEPIGVAVGITPWNSPLILAASKLAPALAAGCTFVLKPSEYSSASSLALAPLFKEAGLPDGVVNVVSGFGQEIGDALVQHPRVAKISFTGGESAGRSINETAARHFKTVDLELGGKSANIIFDDADLEDALNGAIAGIFAASGQSCIAGSRLLVQEAIHDQVVERLVALASTARMGDPADAATQIGPITTLAQYEKIRSYIKIAEAEGATCVLGGSGAAAPGQFVAPTIFTGVHNQMRIAREEVFGPVLSVIRFADEDDAVSIANDSPYGLAAGIWTQSMRRAFAVSQRLQAGTVWINTYRSMSYMVPFGGYKRSGVGRENGIDAVRSYLQTKSTWVNYAGRSSNPFVMRL
jgi:aldehyde dehydrogenase (NAD+)